MKKKNFLFAGIAILACSVFVSSCSKDEDYAGVDYYEDWTPEQFETFASKSVSIQGEDNNDKPTSITLATERYETNVYFTIDTEDEDTLGHGNPSMVNKFVDYTVSVIELYRGEAYSNTYDVYVDVSRNTSENVSISAELASINVEKKVASVNVTYTYNYQWYGHSKTAKEYDVVLVEWF